MGLGAVVVLAVAFVLLLPTIRERYPSQNTANLKANLTFQTLETGDANTLESITVNHVDGEHYTLLYRDKQLYLQRTDGDNEMVNESYVDTIIEAATVIAIEDTVTTDETEVTDYVNDMGLAPPQITVQVSYADGHTVEIQLGNQVPGTTYYYYRWSGDTGIYMCDAGIYEAFKYTEHMLLPVEQPTLVPALIDHMTLQTQVGELMEFTFVADGTETYLGTMRQPYVYPMDHEATQTLLSAVQNFRLGTKMGPVTADNRAEYGFDTPSVIMDVHQQQGLFAQDSSEGVLQTYQTEEQTIRLKLGAKDGEYFYFCEYAGDCYRVSSFLVTTLVSAAADKYVSRAPADMGTASIASIQIQLGSGELDVRATYTEQVEENNQIKTDDDGNTLYDVAVTLNGATMPTDAFDSLVARLKQMTVSGVLDGEEAPTGTPRWQITLTTTGGNTRTLAAYPLDAFSDVLVVDGVAYHYLNAEAIQIALAELYPS